MYIVSDYIIKNYSNTRVKSIIYAYHNLLWLTQRVDTSTLIKSKEWVPYLPHSIINIEISYITYVKKINKKIKCFNEKINKL